MNSEFVAVAKRPKSWAAEAALLAAAWSPDEPPLLLESELFLLALEPKTPPSTAARMTTTPTGIPNLIQGLTPRFARDEGAIKPADSL